MCVLFFVSSQVMAQDVKIEVSQLGKNLYKFTPTTTFSVNMTVMTGPDGILLVDTGMPLAAESIKNELAKISDKKVKYIINTHFHNDHFGGNSELGADAVKIAHPAFRENLSSGLNVLQEYGDDVLPQVTVDKELILHFNDQEVQLIALPGSHSNADLIVYFPSAKVACVSSIVFQETLPYVGPNDGGNVLNYPKILQFLLKKFAKDVTFVTGHGENSSYADVKRFKNMIESSIATVKGELAAKKTVKEMQEQNILKMWEHWAVGFVKTDMWIKTIADALKPVEKKVAKESVAIPVFYTYRDHGLAEAIEYYHKLKTEQPNKYNYDEFGLNFLGYSLMNRKKYKAATAFFKLNVEMFPNSANVYDSLGEVYEKSGNIQMAKENYKQAVDRARELKDANLTIFEANLKRVSSK